MSDPYADLERELVDLGRMLVVEEPSDALVASVLGRVAGTESAAPATGPSATADRARDAQAWWRGRSRRVRVAVAALAAAIGLALVPPVRAAVLELLRIGGVEIQPGPAPSSLPRSPGGADEGGARPLGSLEEASREAGFEVSAPDAFGRPSRIELVEDGRVVALTWTAGGGRPERRLDVFDGTLDWGYLKTVWSALEPVSVDGREGAWIAADHEIRWIDRSGRTRPSPPRLAGPTLVWVGTDDSGRELTYRLEGVADLPSALEAARSVR